MSRRSLQQLGCKGSLMDPTVGTRLFILENTGKELGPTLVSGANLLNKADRERLPSNYVPGGGQATRPSPT
ncbi:hypothetical protein AMTR_s00144p00030930 [Amborella trichopoda]|uniref:Uncharacterized protein n=1 Tax=Amborella trichopoda TaxID=13333 RepID=W1P7R5_AMBTC|nr:hypothetical protein AMTR_s00144p00030930 [Amborella trichopoda]